MFSENNTRRYVLCHEQRYFLLFFHNFLVKLHDVYHIIVDNYKTYTLLTIIVTLTTWWVPFLGIIFVEFNIFEISAQSLSGRHFRNLSSAEPILCRC